MNLQKSFAWLQGAPMLIKHALKTYKLGLNMVHISIQQKQFLKQH